MLTLVTGTSFCSSSSRRTTHFVEFTKEPNNNQSCCTECAIRNSQNHKRREKPKFFKPVLCALSRICLECSFYFSGLEAHRLCSSSETSREDLVVSVTDW